MFDFFFWLHAQAAIALQDSIFICMAFFFLDTTVFFSQTSIASLGVKSVKMIRYSRMLLQNPVPLHVPLANASLSPLSLMFLMLTYHVAELKLFYRPPGRYPIWRSSSFCVGNEVRH
ncbi:hypothetical protein EV126DRAFT_52225 [Verticillium dahliae]|nr:hypothetical protein EV126DRAFT_52225 [Verticillium dahliae]